MSTESTVPLHEMSAALDEIYRLRAALAFEALLLHESLWLKTFPKSRRDTAEKSVKAMLALAAGEKPAPGSYSHQSQALRAQGIPTTLTRAEFLAQVEARR